MVGAECTHTFEARAHQGRFHTHLLLAVAVGLLALLMPRAPGILLQALLLQVLAQPLLLLLLAGAARPCPLLPLSLLSLLFLDCCFTHGCILGCAARPDAACLARGRALGPALGPLLLPALQLLGIRRLKLWRRPQRHVRFLHFLCALHFPVPLAGGEAAGSWPALLGLLLLLLPRLRSQPMPCAPSHPAHKHERVSGTRCCAVRGGTAWP
jgi:hypothetical protein